MINVLVCYEVVKNGSLTTVGHCTVRVEKLTLESIDDLQRKVAEHYGFYAKHVVFRSVTKLDGRRIR